MNNVTRGFCWHQKFVPWGGLPNSWKDLYKVRGWRDSFYDHSDETFCWHKNVGPNGLSAPAQGLCLHFFFLDNCWFKHSLGTQVSDTGPMVFWFLLIKIARTSLLSLLLVMKVPTFFILFSPTFSLLFHRRADFHLVLANIFRGPALIHWYISAKDQIYVKECLDFANK